MNYLRTSHIRALAPIICVTLLATRAVAATWTVNGTGDDGTGSCSATKCTLRDAIITGRSGDTIQFALPAPSAISLTNGELVITKTLAIKGPGAAALTVGRSAAAGTADFRVFNVDSGTFVDISGMTITNGKAPGSSGGGGILSSGELHVANCVITRNVASQVGGGIANTGNLTIEGTTIAENAAAFGGGIHNKGAGSAAITNTTISGNTSASIGAGIANFDTATLTIGNSTVSGNVASGSGGGLYNASSTAAVVNNSTLTANTATNANQSGGGIVNVGAGTVKLRSTIVAKNSASIDPDIASTGSVPSQGYNLIGINSSGTIVAATGDQIGTPAAPIDPLVGPLQDNGGATKTHALLTNSRAIDKGDSGGQLADQRGLARPVDSPVITNGGDGSDVGAYEVQTDQLAGCSEINLVVNSTADSGGGSLRWIMSSACGGSTITFAASVRGAITLTSGELLIDKNLTIKGPGANLLAVQRTFGGNAPLFRIFNVSKANTNVAISGLTVAGGFTSQGGGIYSLGTLTLDGLTVSGNSANNGGGFYNNFGAVTITNSTFSGNSVNGVISGSGGGIFNFGGRMNLTNTTISGNTAVAGNNNHDDSGGGIYTNVGNVVFVSCTVAGNTADLGGGMRNGNGGMVKSRNSIFALNTSAAAPDFYGALESLGFTLIGDSTQTTTTQTGYDQIGTAAAKVDPLLGPLQNNGGPTPTRALLPGSPAIDRGGGDGAGTDQRGSVRPSDDPAIPNPIPGDGSDIGAYEVRVASQLLNLSTRKQVGAGDNVLIGGFIVAGTEAKKVIVRGLGPSLPVSGPLGDPALEIHSSDSTLLASNNNWKDTQAAEVTATGIPPSNDLESAVVISLAAKPLANGGAGYTAILAGNGGGTGIGLLEIYDIGTSANSKLVNISTRGFVGTGNDLLIGGFIPGPSDRASIKVLVRALGPSLASVGVSAPLQDPVLELHDGNGALLQANDDWKDTQRAEIAATGVPPANDRESALVATLPASNAGYTAVVRGSNNSTGVGLVEVYSLQ